MTLAELAEAIKELLDAAPQETWSGIKLGVDVEVKLALDASEEFKGGAARLLVVPVAMEYSKEDSQGRVRIRNLAKIPRIALILSTPFKDKDESGLDVSSWNEVRALLNLREEVDQFLFTNVDDIATIETEPPQELMLDKRWFISVSEITFARFKCLGG